MQTDRLHFEHEPLDNTTNQIRLYKLRDPPDNSHADNVIVRTPEP
jgi:hypothetical protein